MTTTEDHSAFFAEPVVMTSTDGVQMDKNRYVLPTTDGMDGKYHPHTRVTTIANVLPKSYGLGLWQADRVAWAMAQRPDLCALLASVPVDDTATIREVRAKAEVVAAMDEGANLGTATHNILGRYSAGEPIDSLAAIFHPDIRAYAALLAENGLTVMPEYIERLVRMRDYDIAGRLDYIMTEADGSLVIVDVKTKGKPESVHEVATQLAPYANADEMFDPLTGRYTPMPPVRRDYGLMIHIHPGSGVATIKKINLRIGLWSVEIAKNALAFSKMTHLATPYVPLHPVKPADSATVSRSTASSTLAPQPPAHPYRNGQPTPQAIADTANAVLDEVHARIGSTVPHGVVTPATQGPTAAAVAPPTPAAYGAPASVPAPAPYVPQTLPPRAEAVLMTNPDGSDDIHTEADEIEAVFKSKSKAVMAAYAGRYDITDLKHHKAHIAKSIALARADRRKAGLPAEPAAEGAPEVKAPQQQGTPVVGPGTPHVAADMPEAQPQPAVERPQTDQAEQQVLADIACAKTVERIGQIWGAWTASGRAWSGNVQAAADAMVAVIQAGPSVGTDEPPF